MKKIAILGASYLQVPLINKAIEMGLETHVFAWEDGAVGKDLANFFHPISILDKESILIKCKEINIDGITTIATDIAMPSVNYIAQKLSLIGNSELTTFISTDKFEMRKALSRKKIPCPKYALYIKDNFQNSENFEFPLIVKPTDRSGSRGVTKVSTIEETNTAILKALEVSFSKRVIVEEFIKSEREISVEFISYSGKHYPLAITDKITTREPYFTEIAHHQPANIDSINSEKIFKLTSEILNALGIQNGASHTELYLLKDGNFRVVECAGRMGGDFIGSHLVELSTGFDFLAATLDVALNQFDYSKYLRKKVKTYSGVYFVISKSGKVVEIINYQKQNEDVIYCEALVKVGDILGDVIDGSDKRSGVVVYSSHEPNPIIDPSFILQVVTE